MRRERTPALITAGAAIAAIVVPAMMLRPARVAAPVTGERPRPIVVADAPALASAIARHPFGVDRPDAATPEPIDTTLPGPAPDLAGIVGRFPDDAVAMVRIGSGRTQTLAVGGTIGGWRLDSLSPKRATFTRSDRQVVRTVE